MEPRSRFFASMKKWLKRGFLSLLAVFCGLQFVPVNRANPALDPAKKLRPPPEVEAILRASCYDCHSDETRWPWYSYVAPVSWWIANHVQDGRRKLNLSQWADLTPRPGRREETDGGTPLTTVQYKRKILGDMETDILEGRMPLPSYLLIHTDARMTPQQFTIVSDWLNATMAQLGAPTPPGAAK
jgi:hypothetical protein